MSDPALRPSRRYLTMVVASISLIVLTCVAFLVPVPYVALSPGPAYDTLGDFDGEPMFTFGQDVKTYPTKGSLAFTSVRVTAARSEVSLAEAFDAYFADDTAVVPRSTVYPETQSVKDSEEESRAQLVSSKDSSRVAALRSAGYTVPEPGMVVDIVPGDPADGRLQKGDIVRSVDGRSTPTREDVAAAIGRVDPGDTVVIEFVRKGDEKSIGIVTRPDPENTKEPRIGVSMRPRFDFPVEIENNVGARIGGSSAGTMFALAIYDRLTPGSLTGGLQVAGTGTIAADGTVGPIGGVAQKMVGAAAQGATVFLVPADNCEAATGGGDQGMRLVKVSTLAGAIDALNRLAKDPKASVPRCT
ncbi:MAG: YlbL family protein [Aeromicrobium sp.]